MIAAGTSNLTTFLGGPGITIVLLIIAITTGVAIWKANHHKAVIGILGALIVVMIASLAVNVDGRRVLGAWLVSQVFNV